MDSAGIHILNAPTTLHELIYMVIKKNILALLGTFGRDLHTLTTVLANLRLFDLRHTVHNRNVYISDTELARCLAIPSHTLNDVFAQLAGILDSVLG